MGGWEGGWMDGWMDGRKSRFKDCLQQSKMGLTIKKHGGTLESHLLRVLRSGGSGVQIPAMAEIFQMNLNLTPSIYLLSLMVNICSCILYEYYTLVTKGYNVSYCITCKNLKKWKH